MNNLKELLEQVRLAPDPESDESLLTELGTALWRRGFVDTDKRPTAEELLTAHVLKSECELCEAHAAAAAQLPGVLCPNPRCSGVICGKDLLLDLALLPLAIGQGYDSDRMELALIGTCSFCLQTFALTPERVIWNANHDVYYTGGKKFTPGSHDFGLDKKLGLLVREKINQWITRRDAGEVNLGSMELSIWVRHAIQQVIAEYLVEWGLKR